MKFLNDLNINENSLKNGRFEEVSSLPSTNLFVGRQVVYNNKIYIYTDSGWISTSQIKYKTTAEWETENPILLKGEMGYDSTSKRYKIGDGVKNWNKLQYEIDTGVLSSGQQLVVNGNGILGDNTNFSQLVYDPIMSFNGSPGVFKQSKNGVYNVIISDLFIPIDTTKKYRMSIDIASVPDTESTHNYMFLDFYDIDKLQIQTLNVEYYQGSTTTLARDLKRGDTEIYVTDLSGFTHQNGSHRRAIIFWDYKNSYGYQYPKETYSRYVQGNLWTNEEQLDYINNKIILNSPWSGKEHLAGCDISQGVAALSYIYLKNENVTSLTHWSATIGGFNDDGLCYPGEIPQGVAYAKIGFLLNLDKNTNARTAISNIRLEEVTEDLRYPLTLFNKTYNGTRSLTIDPSNVVGAMEDGNKDITDNTEFITSNANGFNYSGSVNVPYRRKATYIWNWIKSKINSDKSIYIDRNQMRYGTDWSINLSKNPYDIAYNKFINQSFLKNMPLNAVDFYISFDNGVTWRDFFEVVTNTTKEKLVGYIFNLSNDGDVLSLGSSAFNSNENKWLRVDIQIGDMAYFQMSQFMCHVSTDGVSNPTIHLSGHRNDKYTNGTKPTEEWTEFFSNRFAGWSGWNSYGLNESIVFGSSAYSIYDKLRIELRGDVSKDESYAYRYGPSLFRFMLFGPIIHYTFSNNKSDIKLSYSGDMTFPAKITTSGVVIPNGTASQVLLANGGKNTLKTINSQSLLGSGNIDITQLETNIADYNNFDTEGNEWFSIPFHLMNPINPTPENLTTLLSVESSIPLESKIIYNPFINLLSTNISALDNWGKLIGNISEDSNRWIYLVDILNFFLDDKDSLITDTSTNKTWLKTLTANTAPTKSISTMISEGIAKVVANAPASFDTLKEIADWISTHQNDASAMNTAINTNTTNITNLTTTVNTNTTNISANATQINGIKGDITSINSVLQSLTNEINTLKTELQNAKTEIAYLKSVAPIVTAEDGFYVVDANDYIGFKVDNNGATDSATTSIETTNI